MESPEQYIYIYIFAFAELIRGVMEQVVRATVQSLLYLGVTVLVLVLG